jgi:hypothetical protein
MEQVVGYVLLGILAVVVAFYVAWILLALLFRLISLLVVYWIVGATVFVIVGIAKGLLIPFQVLRGRGTVKAVITTPARVVANDVLPTKAKGQSKHYGWDRAWPNYVPYQASEDANAVRAEASQWLSARWKKLRGNVKAPNKIGISAAAVAAGARRGVPWFMWNLFVPIPYVALWIGVWFSLILWTLVMTGIGVVTYVAQAVGLTGLRWYDEWSRRLDSATVKCPHCYEETSLPSYRCSGAACTIVHRSLVPGALGVLHRRCECGALLPTGISRASSRLQAVCPYCNEDLAAGSGTRRTVQVPVVGAVASGKTRFIASAVVGLRARLEEQGDTLQTVSGSGDRLLDESRDLIRKRTHTIKTQPDARPVGVPLVVASSEARAIELQFLDAAGEYFADWDTTAELRYIDSADAMLLVLDPLAIPAVAREVRTSPHARGVLVVTTDQEEVYAAVVDRLRAENVRLDRRSLGVVLSKGDVLTRLAAGKSLKDAGPNEIREWLIAHDLDLFVNRMEKDFRTVTYFLVDSMRTSDPHASSHPLKPIEWLCVNSGAELFPSKDATTSFIERVKNAPATLARLRDMAQRINRKGNADV